jgi:hypothetical protein
MPDGTRQLNQQLGSMIAHPGNRRVDHPGEDQLANSGRHRRMDHGDAQFGLVGCKSRVDMEDTIHSPCRFSEAFSIIEIA